MRFVKLTLAVMVVAGVLAGLAAEVQAAGGGESCLVSSFADLKDADKIKGSAVLQIVNWAGPGLGITADSIDATLTLSYKGTTAVFHTLLSPPPLIVSAEEVMCAILAANPTSTAGTISSIFGFAPSQTLKLCLVVNLNTQSVLCQSIEKIDLSQIPTTLNWTAVVDKLTIYVIP